MEEIQVKRNMFNLMILELHGGMICCFSIEC